MIDNLKPYPAMKDSGVPWLGEVPEHWEVRKLKYAVSFSGGGTPSKAEASFWGGRIPWVSPKDMTRARIADSVDHITEEAVSASATNIVPPGALLMVVRSGILRRTIPVAINAVDVTLNQDMKALHPRAGVVASDYLRALVQGNEGALIQEWTKQGATVESIEHEFLANSLVSLPPLPEQSAIVRFLDHADRRIRRYIRAKQKLIKLLEEQKQAIIHRAVTRGLDTNVRLKPSGVEWLGDVPEHWESPRLKRVLSRPTRNGLFKKKDSFGSGAPLVNVADVYREDFRVVFERLDRVQATPSEVQTFQVQRGDIFFVRSSLKLEGTGRSAVVLECQPNTVFECHLVQARPNQLLVDPRFLVTQLNSFGLRHYLISQANVVTMATIAQDVIATCPLWLPPLPEQAEILSFIDRETADLGGAARAAHREINLLREYRTRLIADVVTGKLDVREAATRLPDEVEEPEPLAKIEAAGDTDEADAGDTDTEPEEAEG